MYEITKKIAFTGGGVEGDSALRFTLGRRRMVAYRIVQDIDDSPRSTKISRDDALVELYQWIGEADEAHPIKAYELVGPHDLPRKLRLDEGQRRVREYMVLGNCRTRKRAIPKSQRQERAIEDEEGQLKDPTAAPRPRRPQSDLDRVRMQVVDELMKERGWLDEDAPPLY